MVQEIEQSGEISTNMNSHNHLMDVIRENTAEQLDESNDQLINSVREWIEDDPLIANGPSNTEEN